MNLIIHRGADQIGGTCVEVYTDKTRVIIDLGMPLSDDSPRTLPPVKGLYGGADNEKPVDAFLLSHPHQDHYGLCKFIRADIPVYLSKDAGLMLGAADVFLPNQFGEHDKKVFLEDRKPVNIGDITIIPYLMDHSGYGALAFLLAANGKKILYSGDFRGHGRKKLLFEKFLKSPPGGVDVLLMEGTMLGRATERVDLEEALEDKIVKQARDYPGMKLIACSGQNVDRIVTFYRAAKRSGALFVLDLYVANILHELKRKTLPSPANGFKDVRVLFTKHFMRKLEQKKMPDWYKRWRPYEISPAELRRKGSDAFIIYRERSQAELEAAGIPPQSVLFYSQWSGYKAEASFKPTQVFCKKYAIDITEAHTSGHAPLTDLKRFAGAVGAQHLIPIHTFEPAEYQRHFENVKILQDGEIFRL